MHATLGLPKAVVSFTLLLATLLAVNSVNADRGRKIPTPEQHQARGHQYSSTELLVKLRNGVSADAAGSIARVNGVAAVKRLKRPRKLSRAPIDGWRVVVLGKGANLQKVRASLLKNPNVERVELNYRVQVNAVPNDPAFSQLWGLNNTGQTGGTFDADVDAPEAWALQTGSPSVVVAVIDTGVDLGHPDLAANIWTNPGEIPDNGIDDDFNGYVDDVHGYDFSAYDGLPQDEHGHGTHVAGTIAAVANNGLGVAGVSWNAKVMAVRFLGPTGSGTTVDAINAVLYAADMGAQVMNNSWGGGGYSQALFDAVATADMVDALFIAAAGNNGSNNDVIANYPSNYEVPNVVAVAATDHLDGLASFSNYGSATVDLGAPGVSIYSTVPPVGDPCCSNPSGYAPLSGTSMATPHVAGAAALLFSQFPSLGHLGIRDRLIHLGDPTASLLGKTATGRRLNLAHMLEDDSMAPAPAVDLMVVTTDGFSATLTWTATGDDGYAGVAGSYDVRYSLTPIDETNFAQATAAPSALQPSPAGTIESMKVVGLEPNTQYYFALKIVDTTGNASAISNSATGMTAPVNIVFKDDFESGGANWAIAGSNGIGGPALWHLSTHRSASPTTAFYYGIEATLNYDSGAANDGTITSAPISLAAVKGAQLSFSHYLETEGLSPYDTARVQVSSDNGLTWVDVYVSAMGTGSQMRQEVIDLSVHDGQSIRLRFAFATLDSVLNGFEGWVVDDVRITGTAEEDGIPPAAVTDLMASNVTGSSVQLQWTASADDGHYGAGPATAYDLRYFVQPIDESNFDLAIPVTGLSSPGAPGTLETHEVTDLSPSTTYYFALRVLDNVGNVSLLSNVATATTDAASYGLIYFDGFDTGAPGWTIDVGEAGNLWHLSTHRYASPTKAFYYGREDVLTYDTGARNAGSITSPPIDLTQVKSAALSFMHFLQTENLAPFDTARVQASADGGMSWQDLYVSALGTDAMIAQYADLSLFDGKVIRLRFSFDTVDGAYNWYEGWVVDDVRVTGWSPGGINHLPVANPGGPYSAAKDAPVVFSGFYSYDPEGAPLTYRWDFGDGSISTEGPEVMHAYPASGTYTVTLVVNDGQADSAPASTIVSIGGLPPLANAGGPYAAFKGKAVVFDGSASSDPDGDALTYTWYFGDGATGAGVSPAHSYAQSGTYTATLVVSDGTAIATAYASVAIANQAPVAGAGGPYDGFKAEGIAFNGSTSFDPDGDPLTYVWIFGDGTTAYSPNPTHVYATSGTYTVTLTVNDGEASATATTTATVTNRAPNANAGGPYSGFKNTPVAFNGSTSSDPDGDSLTYTWAFGDGGTGSGPAPSHVYAASGTYTVTLTVGDGETTATATTTVTVSNRSPLANAGGPYAGLKKQAIAFDGSASTDPDGDPLTYAWNFGDGTVGAGASVTHEYAASGTYTVTLAVSDGEAMATTTATVTVTNRAPVANAGGPYTVNQKQALTLDGTSSADPDGDGLTYAWDFGDGTTGAGATPAHTYASPGAYTVTLVVNDGETSSAPATAAVEVTNTPPVANAGPDQTVVQKTTATLNGGASSDADGAITSASWRQISGPAVTLANPGSLATQFTAPSIQGPDPYVLEFELTVVDNNDATATDRTIVTVVKR